MPRSARTTYISISVARRLQGRRGRILSGTKSKPWTPYRAHQCRVSSRMFGATGCSDRTRAAHIPDLAWNKESIGSKHGLFLKWSILTIKWGYKGQILTFLVCIFILFQRVSLVESNPHFSPGSREQARDYALCSINGTSL